MHTRSAIVAKLREDAASDAKLLRSIDAPPEPIANEYCSVINPWIVLDLISPVVQRNHCGGRVNGRASVVSAVLYVQRLA